MATGTPILTINTPPHNEIILNDINGWIIDCYHKKMQDNADPLYGSAYFDTQILGEKILEISDKNIIQKVINTLKKDMTDRLNINIFTKRFINALN